MIKLTEKQLAQIKHEIPDFIDKEFPKQKEESPTKGERGIAIVAVTLFIHYLRSKHE